jgi:lsr operon transcriptional repressor
VENTGRPVSFSGRGRGRARAGDMNDDQHQVRAAWLYYMEGLTQSEIADRLGLTRLRVNRLLADARAEGLVRVTLNTGLASCLALEEVLKRETGLRDAVIVPTPEDSEQVHVALGRATAAFLARYLDANDVTGLGVGWGMTLRETIRHVQPRKLPALVVNSIMGGLTHGSEMNTFEIASELARRLGASYAYMAAPIYAGSPRSRDTILAQDVFKESLDRMRANELTIVSMGDLTKRSLMIRHGVPRDVSVQDLKAAGAVGDIIGHFVDADGKPISHAINQRVIGLPIDELRRIKTVVVTSGGTNKTKVIAAALRGKLMNVLVCDEKTASAALDIFRQGA